MGTLLGLKATLLTPMAYHGLMADGGSSTIADLLSDKAMAFAVAESLGWMAAGAGLPSRPDYRKHLGSMPYRTSLFLPRGGENSPRLGLPQARKLNIDAEGGRPSSLAGVTGSGNVKDYFTIQETLPGATYEGVLWWKDGVPNELPDAWVVRMGLGRQAMVQLERIEVPGQVSLNAHTAGLFARPLACGRYYLHTLQATEPMTPDRAANEMAGWH